MKSANLMGALACAIAATGCATQGGDTVRKGVADAATLPLKDIGIIRPEIPAPLLNLEYPYKSDRLYAGCAQVQYEIGQLDVSLGEENYQPRAEKSLSQKGEDAAAGAAADAATGAAADLIPFRGWIRMASGASKADRQYARAIELGQTRRAFLRGYGAALGCNRVVPAPPPPKKDAAVDPSTPPPAARDQPTPSTPR